jgi:hypothetical protein
MIVRQRPSLWFHKDVDYRRYRSHVRWIYPHFGQTDPIRHRSIHSKRTMYRSDLQANVPGDQSEPRTRPEPKYNTRIRYSGRFRRGNSKSCKFHFRPHILLCRVILIHIACGYTSIADQQGPWTWGTYGIEANHAWKGSGSKRTFRRSRSKNEYVHLLPSSLLTSYTFWDCANACSHDSGAR